MVDQLTSIVTNKFELTPAEFFNILVRNYLKKRSWVIVVLIAMGGFAYYFSDDLTFLFIYLIYPVILLLRFWLYANSRDNKILFRRRNIELSSEKLMTYYEDGTTNSIRLENLRKLERTKTYYLLFITKGTFYYVPFNAFKNVADQHLFEHTVLTTIKNDNR